MDINSLWNGRRHLPRPAARDDANNLQVFARRLAALFPLTTEELAAAQQLVTNARGVASYEDIICEGESPKKACILLEGLACRYKVVGTGRRQMTGFLVPGDVCDFSFLSSSPTPQGVLAVGPTLVGDVELTLLSAVAEQMPRVMVALLRAAAAEQASAHEFIISLGARDAVGRLAHLMCEIHYRLKLVGLVRPGEEFDLAMTQAELGEALGLSTVHVNRTVQQLRQLGIIAMRHGVVSIRDLERLIDLAEFNPRYLRPGR